MNKYSSVIETRNLKMVKICLLVFSILPPILLERPVCARKARMQISRWNFAAVPINTIKSQCSSLFALAEKTGKILSERFQYASDEMSGHDVAFY